VRVLVGVGSCWFVGERLKPLIVGKFPQRNCGQGRPSGAASAGLTLDGGESGGIGGLSADAVTLCLRVFKHLASHGWRIGATRRVLALRQDWFCRSCRFARRSVPETRPHTPTGG